MSSFFFNGQLYISPTTVSAVIDGAMADQSPNIGNNVCLLGPSTGGQPNTKLTFSSPQQAQATLISGDLLDAVTRAFAPSTETGGPAQVFAIRVNPAVQASLTLLDANGAPSIDLLSADWGQYTNQLKVKVEAGSATGLKVTVGYGQSYYVGDNLARQPFQVAYSGLGTGSIAISNAANTLTLVGNSISTTISLTQFPTVQQLVDNINVVTGFTATVLGGFGATIALDGLDDLITQAVTGTPYVVNANLQAVVDWFNSGAQPLVVATRDAAATAVPVPLPYTYLTGGSDGSTTNTNWSNAFTTLQGIDAQWISAVTSAASIHAMADAHAQYMSTVGKKERRNISGMALGSTDAEAIAEAFSLNSDRTSLVHIGFYDFNAAGTLTLYAPYILAGMIAGMFASVPPGTPLTNKTVTIRGVERVLLNPTNTDALLQGGVMPIEVDSTGFTITQSISTWLTNTNFNRTEQSCGAALDYTVRFTRQQLDVLRGQGASPLLLAKAISITDTALRACAVPAPVGPGTIVGDTNSPAYKNITSSISGDIVQVAFQCSPVIPANYVGVTVNAVPYSGSASLAA